MPQQILRVRTEEINFDEIVSVQHYCWKHKWEPAVFSVRHYLNDGWKLLAPPIVNVNGTYWWLVRD